MEFKITARRSEILCSVHFNCISGNELEHFTQLTKRNRHCKNLRQFDTVYMFSVLFSKSHFNIILLSAFRHLTLCVVLFVPQTRRRSGFYAFYPSFCFIMYNTKLNYHKFALQASECGSPPRHHHC